MGRAKGGIAAVVTQPRNNPGDSKARLEDSTTFACTIEFVLFPRSGAGNGDGFTIAKAIHEGTGEIITLKGKFGPVVAGELIQIERSAWRDDARYGSFVQVWARSHADPITRDAVISYLENLPGVGPTLAAAIVETHGNDCLAKIDADPGLILKVTTKGGRHLQATDMAEIMDKWDDLRADRLNMLYLSSLGLGDATAKKVSAHFHTECQNVLKENPYAMTQVEGVGFRIADVVAHKLGIVSNDPRRLAAGMEYLLQQAENDGHVCLPRAEMLERAPKLLERGFKGPTPEQLNTAIDSMVADGRLWSEEQEGVERIYTTEMYVVETRLYEHLESLLKDIDDPDAIPGYLISPKESILTDEQYEALWRGRNYRLSLLTGGPGAGKTTTLCELLDDLDARGETYCCLAPTGKAAKRMKESTGRDAQTVHRKLGWAGRETPKQMTGSGRADDSEEFREDVVIVDEFSMMDMRLTERLLSHLRPETRVICVGDPDQLPAVGAGSVLLDLIESKRVPRTHLTKVFRQQVQGKNVASLLLVNAARIRDGKEPYWSKAEAEADIKAHASDPNHEIWDYIPAGTEILKDDFRFTEITTANAASFKAAPALTEELGVVPAAAVTLTLALASTLSDEFGVGEDEVVVTSPMRKGGTGTYILNQALQRRRNPNGLQFRDGDQPLRVGDRVMNIKNRYGKYDAETGESDPDIMNGDTGRVSGFNAQTKVTTVEFEDGVLTYGKDELDALIPAYASTTHKLQGSEAPAIICPYVGAAGSRMLTRNLVYTAITRGKQMAHLIGDKEVIREAVKRDGSRRNTTLDLRVGAIPKLLKARFEKVASANIMSAQQLLGGFALARIGHRDLMGPGAAAQKAENEAADLPSIPQPE
jgi:exodeoxyribonuclease V alpha subunit